MPFIFKVPPPPLTAWNVSGATYDNIFKDVSSEDTAPVGLTFSTDGTKMYIAGSTNAKTYYYSLSTAWDLNTATFITSVPKLVTNSSAFSNIRFKADGTKMYEMQPLEDRVFQFSLSTAWDITSRTYDNIFKDFSAQETSPYSFSFNQDGTSIYVVGTDFDTVFQYSLNTPWDISNTSYTGLSFNISAQETSPRDVIFKSDGTKMYVVGNASDTVYQYSLSTAWDVSTASLEQSFAVTQDGTPVALAFKSDGAKMYISGNNNNTIFQYTL